jgi:hypothetical protein
LPSPTVCRRLLVFAAYKGSAWPSREPLFALHLLLASLSLLLHAIAASAVLSHTTALFIIADHQSLLPSLTEPCTVHGSPLLFRGAQCHQPSSIHLYPSRSFQEVSQGAPVLPNPAFDSGDQPYMPPPIFPFPPSASLPTASHGEPPLPNFPKSGSPSLEHPP